MIRLLSIPSKYWIKNQLPVTSDKFFDICISCHRAQVLICWQVCEIHIQIPPIFIVCWMQSRCFLFIYGLDCPSEGSSRRDCITTNSLRICLCVLIRRRFFILSPLFSHKICSFSLCFWFLSWKRSLLSFSCTFKVFSVIIVLFFRPISLSFLRYY
jgi:hypothetical protein